MRGTENKFEHLLSKLFPDEDSVKRFSVTSLPSDPFSFSFFQNYWYLNQGHHCIHSMCLIVWYSSSHFFLYQYSDHIMLLFLMNAYCEVLSMIFSTYCPHHVKLIQLFFKPFSHLYLSFRKKTNFMQVFLKCPLMIIYSSNNWLHRPQYGKGMWLIATRSWKRVTDVFMQFFSADGLHLCQQW